MTIVIRQATLSDAAPIWAIRYAVGENTLTPGRITDEELRVELEDTGRGWVLEQDARPLWLTTGPHTRAAVFYERRGWRRVGILSNGEARYELPD